MRRALAAVLSTLAALGAGAAGHLVPAQGKQCVPGLHRQPMGGPFSVFLFCDDAAGSNIGIVNTEGAAGPGRIELPHPRRWNKWAANDRFWQEREWATDVTSFAWTADLKALFVATSSVYGTGALYKLDLVERTYARLLPQRSDHEQDTRSYSTEIISIDLRTGEVSAKVTSHDPVSGKSVSTMRLLR